MKIETLHCVGDKAIYDALCQKNGVTNASFQELFLKRGIINSPRTDRKSLAGYFSTLIHDFDDYSMLSDILGTPSGRERNASVLAKSGVSFDDYREAVSTLKEEINSSDEECTVSIIKKEHGIEASLLYKEFNPNKNEFSQYTTRKATFVIEDKDEGVNVRYPDNSRAKEWVDRLIGIVRDETGEEVTPERVSLSSVNDPGIRNQFFRRLIHSVDYFVCEDVTDVYVYHPESVVEDDDDFDEDGFVKEAVSSTHISRASLKGVGVLESNELKDLYDRGFYLSKIVWLARKKGHHDSGKYIFEAGVSSPENFSGFRYLVRGVHGYMGPSKYTKNPKRPDSSEERLLNNYIEKAALNIVNELVGSYEESLKQVEESTSSIEQSSDTLPKTEVILIEEDRKGEVSEHILTDSAVLE